MPKKSIFFKILKCTSTLIISNVLFFNSRAVHFFFFLVLNYFRLSLLYHNFINYIRKFFSSLFIFIFSLLQIFFQFGTAQKIVSKLKIFDGTYMIFSAFY